jgi:hypothetical protein
MSMTTIMMYDKKKKKHKALNVFNKLQPSIKFTTEELHESVVFFILQYVAKIKI